MREEARKKAAEALARKRGGWWGTFGHNLKESFKSVATGVDHTDQGPSTRVGSRKRTVSWRDSVPSQAFARDGGDTRGGTMPVSLALVPVLAKVDEYSRVDEFSRVR